MNKIVIAGGGVIGLFTAFYLSEAGFEVTILDKGNLEQNCSVGNAGMIVPSHIIPLASPGIVEKGLKWMFSSTSPFYIHPKLDRRLIQWCWSFYNFSTQKHVTHSIPYLKNISIISKGLYSTLNEHLPGIDQILVEKGLLMLYKTREAEIEEKEFARVARENGLEVEILSHEGVQQLEPNFKMNVQGGLLFPDDAHLDPARLTRLLIEKLEARGVKIVRNTEILDFAFSGKSVSVVLTDKGEFFSDYLIICAGSVSGVLARKLKVNLPLLGGKGYSFMAENSPEIQRAAILTERKVTVTPLGGRVRFGGTMEITDSTEKININRVKGIHNSISQYYESFECNFPKNDEIWSGLRPCSPDGLPYIGFTKRYSNVLFGSGHSMMGISLAPATGKILTELLKTNKPSMQIDAFSPDRFS